MLMRFGLGLVLVSVSGLMADAGPSANDTVLNWVSLPSLDASKHSKVLSIAVSGNDVYAGGFSKNKENVSVPGYWKNGNWVGLKPLVASKDSEVAFLTLVDNHVFAAGYSTDASHEMIPGYWKNGTWTPLTKPAYATDARVLALAVHGNDVYASGFLSVMDHPFVTKVAAHWKNAVISTTAKPNDLTEFSSATSVTLIGSDVIAGGFLSQADRLTKPGYWKNHQWTELPPMNPAYSAAVNSVFGQGNAVLAAGHCYNATGNAIPGFWEKGVWQALPSGDGTKDGSAVSLIPSQNGICIGGTIDCLTDVMTDELYGIPGYWQNQKWNGWKQPEGIKGSWVNAMVLSGGRVYCGGWTINAAGIRVPGYWKVQ